MSQLISIFKSWLLQNICWIVRSDINYMSSFFSVFVEIRRSLLLQDMPTEFKFRNN